MPDQKHPNSLTSSRGEEFDPTYGGKVALPPGFVQAPPDVQKVINYLGFDPMAELGDLYQDIPNDLYALRADVLHKLIDRVWPRKTDDGKKDPVMPNIFMNLPERDAPPDMREVGDSVIDQDGTDDDHLDIEHLGRGTKA